MNRPRLLDLFCGAGGCAMGYSRAGFDVVGIDHRPMPRYPFEFVQADALEYLAAHGRDFDAIHASPPCQHYTPVNRSGKLAGREYPDLVAATREALLAAGRPFVIENVVGAPLQRPALVCGSAFGLPIRRHRLFESSILLFSTTCRHGEQTEPRYPSCFQTGRARREGRKHLSAVVQVYGNTAGKALWPAAMGIDWMTSKELAQAIPPAYCEYVGRQLIRSL